MSTYVDFIESVSQSKILANEFHNALKNYSSEKLSSWFTDKGYMVSVDVCDTLVKNKSIHSDKVRSGPQPQY
jgi:hypothetical protein